MKLSIAYVNDVHGYLEPHPELFYAGGLEVIGEAGGYARIASVIREITGKADHALRFDGGDSFHGTLPLVESRGEALVPILNAIGFDAMVGHWDFAYGPQQLKKLQGLLSYPVLGINVYNKDGSRFLQPFIIKEVADVKVGVIGICCNIIDKTMPKHFSEGLVITDGLEELPGMVEEARQAGADVIILLSHNGFPQDVSMLKQVNGIDICLSAHSHNRLYEAVEVNGAIVIQCGCHGSFVGHLQLTLDKKKITDYTYELITVNETIEPDEEVAEITEDIVAPYRQLLNHAAGLAGGVLHRYDTLHSTMDDLLLAAVNYAANTEISFSNGWRYGAPIPAGPVTRWDLYNIIPMNPVLSTVDLMGKEIRQMLEDNLEKTFCTDPMKQMGGYVKRALGISVKMRIENPAGHRIQELYAGKSHCQPSAMYTVAFVTSQGVPEGLGQNRKDLPIKAVEAMENFLLSHPHYSPAAAGAFSLV
jgi:sulfur-oxidizing protein SoxB